MGKGDRRTRRGKIWRGTYGKYRPRKPKNKQPLPMQARPAVQPNE
ncbi:MAG: 30S ribosomal protein THX [Bacteroidia bacterium]|nr:30S ribosomal protein THX [Bacteroidia bacterium]MDW8235533.1 30S ribosomal protein THX [Bacteroidia bacterium]